MQLRLSHIFNRELLRRCFCTGSQDIPFSVPTAFVYCSGFKCYCLNREGLVGILKEDDKEALTICPKHRKHLTTDWPGRKNYIWSYPAYQRLKERLSLRRRVNAKISAEIFVEFKEIVPIGAGE